MRILITNDDGVFAEGIQALAQEIKKLPKHIVAPIMNKVPPGTPSLCTAHYWQKSYLSPSADLSPWKVNGTPADCVAGGQHCCRTNPI